MSRRLAQHGFGADRAFAGGAAFWSGMAYMLIMPLQTVKGRLMRTRIRRAAATSTQEPAAS